MITFYFNSNLPEYYTGDLCEVFDNLMLKFILLLNDKKLPINGYIATNNQPSTILICGKTLKSLIDNFKIAEKDKYKEHRKKLYSFFTRYPIDLDVRVEEVFSEEELTSSIKFHGRDATDLFIANKLKYYFRCVDNKIFIGNMGTKSSYKGDAQSNDIAHAGKVMDKLERTMRN